MMSPDDEPIQTPDKGQKTNNLINEAFNLSASLSNFQPLTVLPPSSNHFQPIHSRTPSTDLKPNDPKNKLNQQTYHHSIQAYFLNRQTNHLHHQLKQVLRLNQLMSMQYHHFLHQCHLNRLIRFQFKQIVLF